MDGQNALILDLGLGGAFVEHYGAVSPGWRFRLLFRWKGEDVEFVCEVARSRVKRNAGDGVNIVSHSGVRFIEAIGGSDARLNDLMATFVGRVLAAQRANAGGFATEAESLDLAQLGGARRVRSRGFVTYRFHDGRWTRESAESSKQPDNGFTVAAFEDEDEIETLCRTYEIADAEGRRLIRLVAELSARTSR